MFKFKEMKKILILVFLIFAGCSSVKMIPQKPIVITHKSYVIGQGVYFYEFKDANGNFFQSYEPKGDYEVGDIIK